MFNIFSKTTNQQRGTSITLKISGLHCTSCALNIDSILEELEGVIESKTNYTQSKSNVIFDDQKTSSEAIINEIEKSGYQAELL